MQSIDIHWQMWAQPGAAAFGINEESTLKLSLETRNRGGVIIVHCHGRIVYRDEAAAFSRVIGEAMQDGSKVVLDLSGVSAIDGAGIGDLAMLQNWARERNATLKCAGANSVVGAVLELTNLDSVLEVHPTLEAALESFREEQAFAAD